MNSKLLKDRYRKDHILTLVIWLLIFVLTLIIHTRLINNAFDDAYIHFRIARNFAESGQPYYNANEPVSASSSPAWTIILSILFKVFSPNPWVIAVLNSICTTAGAYIFSLIFKKIYKEELSIFITGLLIPILFLSIMLVPSIGLMETPATFVMIGITFLLYLHKNPVYYIILGTLPFFRIECGILVLIFLISDVVEHKKIHPKMFLPAIGAMPFVFYQYFYFQTIIPNTISAKMAMYHQTALEIFGMVLQSFFPNTKAFPIWSESVLLYVWLTILIFSIYFILRTNSITQKSEMIFLAFGLSVLAFYIIGKALIFPWYVPLFTVPLLLGSCGCFLKQKKIPGYILFAVLVYPYVSLSGQNVFAGFFNPYIYTDVQFGARVVRYIDTGTRLFTHYPEARLMTSEIGGLGWGFNGYVLDGAGLATPAAIAYHDGSHGTLGIIPIEFIRTTQPDIIVSVPIFLPGFSESELANSYILKQVPVYMQNDLQRIESKEIWGNDLLHIYILKDIYGGF